MRARVSWFALARKGGMIAGIMLKRFAFAAIVAAAMTLPTFAQEVEENEASTQIIIADRMRDSTTQLPTARTVEQADIDAMTDTVVRSDRPEYETTLVVIETTLGDITVALETERAPITANNFLRYADEDRFDGTVFYRTLSVEWGEQPNGFIQGGTQNDPDRILDPIPHEPTNETGVLHLEGALSMARFDPGTATGDFSIMLREQQGQDADPDNEDPNRQLGYAAFGYVVDGMDVVHAIHAAPTDPDKGEGWMKGQMIAEPIEIVDVRRLEPAAE